MSTAWLLSVGGFGEKLLSVLSTLLRVSLASFGCQPYKMNRIRLRGREDEGLVGKLLALAVLMDGYETMSADVSIKSP
ncbi:hypothetical protein TNCV_1189721 [Trichonephila clavipes]|nr:hypothetical protein TNCV_1189721 [Trichonephila clavipes]